MTVGFKKYHLYLDDSSATKKNPYGKTACGRDGRKIGGLIEYFFKYTKEKDRCKTCNKIFGRLI